MIRGRHRAGWGIVAALLAGAAGAEDEGLVDGIAAQVGSDVVLVSEVLQMVKPTETRMREAGVPELEIAKLRAEGLERMIEWRLIEQEVRKSELFASDEEIDTTIASIARANDLSVEELQRSVVSHGMALTDYRAQIKRELERRKLVTTLIGSRIEIEEKDVKDLYDTRYAGQPQDGEVVHVRQIMVSFGEDTGRDKKAARARADAAAARIEAGEAFEVVALDVSEVAGKKGGDLGWIHTSRLASWMAEMLKHLGRGEVSDVMVLPVGYSLLKLVDRKEYQPVSYEAVRPELEREIFERHLAREYEDWMEKLRKRTYIERRGYFAETAQLGPSALLRFGDEPPIP